MIEDAIGIAAQSRLHTQICIVGAGAAGITLALELGRAGRQIILLVGGGRKESDFCRDLHEASTKEPGNHESMSINRRRMWGGATAAWGGRCVPFDAIDFEKRDWMPESGWPLGAQDVAPHYARAQEICEAGANCFDVRQSFPAEPAEIIEGLDNADIVSWPLNRWGPPTHFGKRYEKDLAALPNVRVIFDAHATVLHCQNTPDSISHLTVARCRASQSAGTFEVHAGQFILACGALENARLLLQGNAHHPRGIGNAHDNVGRYYMSHTGTLTAILRVTKDTARIVSGFLQDSDGVYCRRRFWITPEAQRTHRIGNIVMELYEPTEDSRLKHSPFFSSILLGRLLRETLRLRHPAKMAAYVRKHWQTACHHFVNSAANPHRWIPEAIDTARRSLLASRHCPGFIINAESRSFIVSCQGEHSPNRESRVTLAADTDALGMRRLVADPRFNELDVATSVTAHRLLAGALEKSGVGYLQYTEADLKTDLARRGAHFDSMAHQIGTTRMGADPQTSVVDKNAAVWGVGNLYVAGASVFPTSSHANPTLLLIALALRLAEHLKTHPPAESKEERLKAKG